MVQYLLVQFDFGTFTCQIRNGHDENHGAFSDARVAAFLVDGLDVDHELHPALGVFVLAVHWA